MQVKLLYFQSKMLEKETMRIFYNFLKFFNSDKIFFLQKENSKKIFYLKKITIECSSLTFFINFEYLIQFSNDLSDNIQENYIHLEFYLRFSLIEFLRNNLKKNISNQRCWVSLYNLPNKKKFKNFNSKSLNKLTNISGITTQVIGYYPKIFLATFKCTNVNCKVKIWHTEQHFDFIEPKNCLLCGSKKWSFVSEDSIFIFFQKLKIKKTLKFFFHKKSWTIDVHVKYNFKNLINLEQQLILSGCFVVFFNLANSCQKNKAFPLFKKNLVLDFKVKNEKTNIYHSFCFLAYFFYVRKELPSKDSFLCKKLLFFSFRYKKNIFRIRQSLNFLKKFLNLFCNSYLKNEELKIAALFALVGNTMPTNFNRLTKLQSGINICIIDNFIFDKNKLIVDLNKLFSKKIIYLDTNDSRITSLIFKIEETNKYFQKKANTLLENNLFTYIINNFNKLSTKDQNNLYSITSLGKIFFCELEKTNYKKKNSSFFYNYDFKKFVHFSIDQCVFHKFDFCFFLSKTYFNLNNPRSIISFLTKLGFQKNTTHITQKCFHDFQLYIHFIQSLHSILSKKIQKFIVNLYKFLRKQNTINRLFLNKFTIKQLESFAKVSKAISRFYLNTYVEEFYVKLAARVLIFSSRSYTCFEYNFHRNKTSISKNFFTTMSNNVQKKIFIKVNFKELNDIKNYTTQKLKKSQSPVIHFTKKLMLRITKKLFFSKKKVLIEIIKIGLILKQFIFSKKIPMIKKLHF